MAVETEIKIATPVGMVGYSFDYTRFEEFCLERKPDYIIADAGSTDSGPQKLALGSTTSPRESYKSDIEVILRVASKTGAKVLLGSAGGDGTNAHVDLFIDIVEELCQTHGYSFLTASIYSDITKDIALQALSSNRIRPCGPVPDLTEEEINLATNIVAQMGAEPYIEALKRGADVIIGGRSYDPAMYAAACIINGVDEATAWHMGKICECGALCSVPKSRSILATVRRGSFDLEPMDEGSACTPLSVASHTLYEKSRPDILVGPGGALHLGDECQYTPLTGRTLRVSGAKFVPAPYTVKLEGAKPLGYRTVFIGGIRDPTMQRHLHLITPAIEEKIQQTLMEAGNWSDKDCRMLWHIYGRDGVMGALEPDVDLPSKEVCILGEALASTQEVANRMANLARVFMMHVPYPGQVATAGNFASPLTPLELPLGRVCAFNVYHVMDVDSPTALFPVKLYDFDYSSKITNGQNGHDEHLNGQSAVNGIINGVKKAMVSPTKTDIGQSPALKALMSAMSPRPTMKELIDAGKTTATLGDLAQVVRTKNAGPFEITCDVMFANEEIYQWVKDANVLTEERLAKLYRCDVSKITACMFFRAAFAFKFTIARNLSQGSFGETDMHGCQQHVPLLRIELPLPPKST